MTIAAASPAAPRYDFQYRGENLLPVERLLAGLEPTDGTGTPPATQEEPGGVLLKGPANGDRAAFSIPVAVEQGAEYLFRARVRSEDALVARFGAFSMAYNDPGQWQTLSGLYRATEPATARLELHLRSLDPARPASAMIREVSLVRVERPTAIHRRPARGSTELVKEGAPRASIIIPAGSEAYLSLAASIRDAVKARTGVELPILSDRDATEGDFPTLRRDLSAANLILLGRLGNNRALWTAYNHFLTAVDGFYPGGDGYVVHTAANVAHRGGNHLIIGGTTDEGVRRGVGKFLEILAAGEGTRESFRLPWLLEAELQGDCLRLLQKDDALWRDTPESPLLPKPQPGYGNVVRWYRNAMGYYWTGWESYRKRADHYLSQVIREKAYTHHYIAEFFVRTFDMLDESGLLSPEQTRAVDALFLENFLDLMTVGDLHWMTTFTPPYGEINITSRHQIDPWMSDHQLARYLSEVLKPEGVLKELVAFRLAEKKRALTDFVTHRNNPSLPGGGLDEVYEEVNASFFRFALDHDLYREFFASGHALKSLSLDRVNHLTGDFAYPPKSRDTRLLLGMLTSLTRDPELHWLWKHLPEKVRASGYFQNRYLGGIRRYTPDADLPESVPRRWSGIGFTPNPVDNAPVRTSRENYYFLAIRSGFEPGDDYLAFNGVDGTAPSGAVVSLVSGGVTWLGTGNRDANRFQANTATAVRVDQAAGKPSRGDTSHGLWSADLPSGQALRFRQQLTSEVKWTRDAVRLGKGLFVFRDRFEADAEGTYLLGVGWNLRGTGSRQGESHLFTSGGNRLRITMAGDGFTMMPRDAGTTEQPVRAHALRRLRKGESVVVATVVEATDARPPRFRPVKIVDGERLIIGEGKRRTVLDWNPPPEAGFQRAALVIRTPQQTGVYDGIPQDGEDGKRLHFTLKATGDPEPPRQAVQRADRPAAEPSPPIVPRDAASSWSRGWRYDGFLKPARVTSSSTDGKGLYDLGAILKLTEIRAFSHDPSRRARLPKEMLLSSAEAEGWKPAEGQRRWRPGVRTANYGEVHPVPEQDETLLLARPTEARYVKAAGDDPLLFFTGSRLEARHPLRLETGDFLGTGQPQTLVVSDVFPQIPRSMRYDDLSVALLDFKGRPIFQKELDGPVQAIRLLERKAPSGKELFVLYANGTLEVHALDGTLEARADLYRMHAAFAAGYGKHRTRHPAGGYVLPFSVGLWRPNAAGERRVVIGRYGAFTFLNPDLSFEGVLNTGGYGMPGLLAEGLDFGHGEEEQVAIDRWHLRQLGGPGEPTLRDPGGAKFWKQTYELLKESVIGNAISSAPLAGPPLLRYEPLPGLSGQPRFLLLARGTSLALYDGRRRAFHYQWGSQAPLKGVAILEQTPTRLRLLAATADSLLWEFDWKNGLESPPSVHARLLSMPVTSLRECGTGRALLAGPGGLFGFSDENGIEAIAAGAFRDAALLSETPETVVAATERGEILAFRRDRSSYGP